MPCDVRKKSRPNRRRNVRGSLEVRKPAAQQVRDFGRRSEPLLGILRVELRDQFDEPFRRLGRKIAQRMRRRFGNPPQYAVGGFRSKRRSSRTHGVDRAAEAEEIAARVDGFASGLLGQHVLGSAGDHSRPRKAGVVGGPGQSEIGQHDALDPSVKQHVGSSVGSR